MWQLGGISVVTNTSMSIVIIAFQCNFFDDSQVIHVVSSPAVTPLMRPENGATEVFLFICPSQTATPFFNTNMEQSAANGGGDLFNHILT